MKKRKITITSLLAVTLFGSIISISQAEAPTPGSAEDPVITKSYMDQNIQQLIANELSKQSMTEDRVKQLIASALAASPNSGSNGSDGSSMDTGAASAITVIELKAGQTLHAGAGTEIIVRTGKTLAVSNDGNGIPDVTAGKDIPAGAAIETNHLLIFPREGRGIKPDPKAKSDIFVMVRGSYLQLNADGSKVTP